MRRADTQVTVYTSLDRPYSEPILRQFEQDSGIRVEAAYDIEATKTTGLVNRLLAERRNPQADVFWNSEVARTLMLKEEGVLAVYACAAAEDIPTGFRDPEGYWAGFAARARVLVYNTELVPPGGVPRSIFELTEPAWRGKVALANPLFGTTGAHAAALFAALGEARAREYFRALAANDVKIADGNAAVRDQVARGEVWVGFTDTDDVYAGIRGEKPIDLVFPDADGIGTLLIPNTVALIAGGPRPEQGKRLIDYLLSPEVEEALAKADSHQMPVRAGVPVPEGFASLADVKAMDVTFDAIARSMPPSQSFLKELFIR
ncbi:MAG: extracellular solute-binding protein [Armatimonadota bacterium]